MKRSKKIVALAMAALMTAGSGMTVSAGQWQSDTNGWWWQNDDGSYPVGSWQWLDGNNDGTAIISTGTGICLQTRSRRTDIR